MVENLSEVSVRSDLAVVDCNEGIVILKVDFFFTKLYYKQQHIGKGRSREKYLAHMYGSDSPMHPSQVPPLPDTKANH